MRSRESRSLRVLPVAVSLTVAIVGTVIGSLAILGFTLLQSLREFFKGML